MNDDGRKIMHVGMIPFGEDTNPYQELTRRALCAAGLRVTPFPKSNWVPLWRAARSGVDVLHLDWPHSFYRGADALRSWVKRHLFRWQMPRLGSVRVVWTVHNLETHNTGGQGDGDLARLVARADALVSLSGIGVPMIRERWPEAASKPLVSIPHGHFCDWYRTDIPRMDARRALNLPVDARVGAFVGRLQPYKGVEDLVPAFAAVAGPRDWLLIAGAPVDLGYQQRVEKLVAAHPRIMLMPQWVPKALLENILCAADYGVFPFRQIFNSASVILAMSFGLPVVATERGAIPELVPAAAWFNARDGSRQSLADALGEAMKAEGLAERGGEAKRHLLEHHSWHTVGTRLQDLYESLCRDAGSCGALRSGA